MSEERPIVFTCHSTQLLGILHESAASSEHALIVIVGGPQYRVGSHRQFVLLAREVANAGIPVFRFDYRGMGDSMGEQRDFEGIGDDISAAIDTVFEALPGLKTVSLWGLCDAASAIAFYLDSATDERVTGAVILNPWVHDDETEAEMLVKDYYRSRASDPKEILRLLASPSRWLGAIKGIANSLMALVSAKADRASAGSANKLPLPARVLNGISHSKPKKLLIISGDDLTAREFLTAAKKHSGFQSAIGSETIVQQTNEDADHTFSSKQWRDWVA
ncbi:MAG: hydrolase 1, exosortase A system-associated, partial [Pseudomonadota bacterium]